MFETRNQEWSQVVEAHPGVTLIGARASVGATGPGSAAGASYHRPKRVDVGDLSYPMPDHLMKTRIAVAAAIGCALIWRSIRE
jgi:hypothetical protein